MDRLEYLFLALVALTIVVSLQAVGIILVVAMLITPAATAQLLTVRFTRLMLLAAVVGVVSSVIGLYVSYWLDVASGATHRAGPDGDVRASRSSSGRAGCWRAVAAHDRRSTGDAAEAGGVMMRPRRAGDRARRPTTWWPRWTGPGYRLTGPRRAVARARRRPRGPLHRRGPGRGCSGARGIGRATVFRALDLFASLGLVERVDLPAGDHAYVACDSAHHHHAICTSCGRSLDVDDAGLAEVLAAIGRRSGFRVTAHRLEIFGLCAACRSRDPDSR